ncbi:unnamed protein product [Brachionus calyciflorus]|uniref:Uncharacterized protein n=1 Tax=Brachionus calyciflorus TaxID=104777 RepID=A0A813RBN0_9BILA|nr:unnamed protein product [Brachionus calyciflorus]
MFRTKCIIIFYLLIYYQNLNVCKASDDSDEDITTTKTTTSTFTSQLPTKSSKSYTQFVKSPDEVNILMVIGLVITGIFVVLCVISIPWFILLMQKRYRDFFKQKCIACCCCCCCIKFTSEENNQTERNVNLDCLNNMSSSIDPPRYEDIQVYNIVENERNIRPGLVDCNHDPPSYRNVELGHTMRVLNI